LAAVSRVDRGVRVRGKEGVLNRWDVRALGYCVVVAAVVARSRVLPVVLAAAFGLGGGQAVDAVALGEPHLGDFAGEEEDQGGDRQGPDRAGGALGLSAMQG
jgi:hypothetical protein